MAIEMGSCCESRRGRAIVVVRVGAALLMLNRRGVSNSEIVFWVLVAVPVVAVLLFVYLPIHRPRPRFAPVQSDLRIMRTAIESYAVDQGEYPRSSWGTAPYNDRYAGQDGTTKPSFNQLGPWLTTPISYVTTLPPFEEGFESGYWSKELAPYVYINLKTATLLSRECGAFSAADLKTIEEDFGQYLLLSRGPDGTLGEEDGTFFTDFDPTNGTKSAGNIIVRQTRSSP